MESEKGDKEIAQGFREAAQKRNITDMEGHLVWLRDQKIKKRDASRARAIKAEREIGVIDLMLEGKV